MSKIEELFNDYYKESDETVDTPEKSARLESMSFLSNAS